ncbi:MAG: hypothetical protein D6696_17635 [Acidobacteria bacterium]|nr:MAG: hypothetical protein D6696_17635 [Acidobacteriota bacterium]
MVRFTVVIRTFFGISVGQVIDITINMIASNFSELDGILKSGIEFLFAGAKDSRPKLLRAGGPAIRHHRYDR